MSSRKSLAKKGEPVKHIFKQDGSDFKFLLRLFQTGAITDELPAAVRAMHERFQKYNTNQFRSQFNKARGMAAGVALRGPQPPQDDDGPLPILPSFVPRNPAVAARPPAVAQLPSMADNDDEEADADGEDGTHLEPKRMVQGMGERAWHSPCHYHCLAEQWRDRSRHRNHGLCEWQEANNQ
ncbi:hypothetical protein SEMRO_3203_G345160.1 [Seminavis robusta]|uniref:Uncharacterized protein n=1 Tax=Seminavis robusta TaxID=568900 RepID=A0A9N8HZW7_9STRA|nr:hypothetical protein SEMRO_3203_G345160.1 [Seminavis robusta]|eukprot:Sro3203_g345160.1 n/a (181) ;mRNA; f:2160-2702